MAGEEIAFHFIIAGVLWSLLAFFAYGYLQELAVWKAYVLKIALQLPASIPNPLVWARASYCVMVYPMMSFRVFKRFWINHGFKFVLLVGTLCYTWNVWTETLADDPFTIVGVAASATSKEIGSACRKGGRALHPDKHPGDEERIRPLFERHTRACKLLKDDKARKKYIKYGVFPKKDQKDGEVASSQFTGGTVLQVGGGSYILSFCAYFLLFCGLPSIVLVNIGGLIYDKETQIENGVNDCKAISEDMQGILALSSDGKSWSTGVMSSLFIDCADIGLEMSLAEFSEAKARVKEISTSKARSLDTLQSCYIDRVALWKRDAKPSEDAVKSKLASIDKKITDTLNSLNKAGKSQ